MYWQTEFSRSEQSLSVFYLMPSFRILEKITPASTLSSEHFRGEDTQSWYYLPRQMLSFFSNLWAYSQIFLKNAFIASYLHRRTGNQACFPAHLPCKGIRPVYIQNGKRNKSRLATGAKVMVTFDGIGNPSIFFRASFLCLYLCRTLRAARV